MVLPETTAASEKKRTLWKTLFRSLIGIGLLAALLIWNDNGIKVLEIFGGFRSEYLLGLLFVAIALNGISSTKWGLFLHDRGHRLSWWRLFELYLIGKFFSNFLPSMFGGDLARVYMVGRQISSYSVSAASVFLERATGFVGLTILAVTAVLINPEMLGIPIILITISAVVLATVLAVVAFYRPEGFALAVSVADRIPLVRKFAHKIERLLSDIGYYRGRHKLLLKGLFYSLAFNAVAALNIYVSSLAIGFEPQLADIFVVTPVILVLSMIPVSPNNIGWWEWCFSVLLVNAGATAAEGLGVALVIRAMTLVVSLIGGLFLLRKQPAPSAG